MALVLVPPGWLVYEHVLNTLRCVMGAGLSSSLGTQTLQSAGRRSGLGSTESGTPESLLHLFSYLTPPPLPRHPLGGSILRNTRVSAAGRGRVCAGDLQGRRCACAKAGALRMREDGRLGDLSASEVTLVTLVPLRAYPDPLRA